MNLKNYRPCRTDAVPVSESASLDSGVIVVCRRRRNDLVFLKKIDIKTYHSASTADSTRRGGLAACRGDVAAQTTA